jgi:hypothetical protein
MQTATKLILSALALAQLLAAQVACKPLLDAEMKAFENPLHMYTIAAVNGKTFMAESIFVGGNSYMRINGKWSPSGKTSDYTDLMQKKRPQSSNATCSYVKDEAVNGEIAAVYSMNDVLASGSKVASQIWISKSKGVPLRQEDDIETSRGKTHNSTRYEYSNVKPPM